MSARNRALIPPVQREARRLLRDGLRLLGALVVLPNACLWLLGIFWAAPRPLLNTDYALVSLLHPWLGALGAGVLTAAFALVDVAVAGSYHFHGNPAALLQAAPDALRLPLSFTGPIALGVAAAALALGWAVRRLLAPIPRMSGPNLLAAGAALAIAGGLAGVLPDGRGARAVALGDFLDNAVIPAVAMATEYRGLVERPVPAATDPLFDALEAGSPLPERVVLVMLESWGRFRDPAVESAATRALDTVALRSLYRIERGSVAQYGGTVRGELRELCRGRSGTVRPDPALLPAAECLPGLFAGRDYRTAALHGFRSDFFDRERWWPGLGLEPVYFRDELTRGVGDKPWCGTGFEGVCDADVGELIGRSFLGPDAEPGPLFLYWLTLNAHPPYQEPPPGADAAAACDGVPAGLRDPELCVYLAWHGSALAAVAGLARAHVDGRTAWILVGDHPPAFGSPRLRALVLPDSVPWVRLWPRSGSARGAGASP